MFFMIRSVTLESGEADEQGVNKLRKLYSSFSSRFCHRAALLSQQTALQSIQTWRAVCIYMFVLSLEPCSYVRVSKPVKKSAARDI
jgi:hypothetical protein